MSERREFVKVERLGNMARYSVTVPIEVEPIHARLDALERRIEVLQRMVEMHQAKLEETERRIETIERKLNHKGGAE